MFKLFVRSQFSFLSSSAKWNQNPSKKKTLINNKWVKFEFNYKSIEKCLAWVLQWQRTDCYCSEWLSWTSSEIKVKYIQCGPPKSYVFDFATWKFLIRTGKKILDFSPYFNFRREIFDTEYFLKLYLQFKVPNRPTLLHKCNAYPKTKDH